MNETLLRPEYRIQTTVDRECHLLRDGAWDDKKKYGVPIRSLRLEGLTSPIRPASPYHRGMTDSVVRVLRTDYLYGLTDGVLGVEP